MSETENNKRILKKTKLGKKTVLKKINKEPKEIKEEILIVGNNLNKETKENSASFLLKLILKAFYLSIWKRKVKALKYYSRKTNKQRMIFKQLINEISLVINQKRSDYFNEIIEKIDKLPLPENIKHDKYFGVLKIVNKEFCNNKNLDKNSNKYYLDSNLSINKETKNQIKNNENIEEHFEENNNKEIIYEDGSKQMDLNNNDFNENEYDAYENQELNVNDRAIDYNNVLNIGKNDIYRNDIEEDEVYLENEYDYKQDILKDENYYNNHNINDNKYYQVDEYYNNNVYNNENNYIENDVYYYDNNIYDKKIYVPNNNINIIDFDNNNYNNDIYYENQYHYYYNDQYEENNYETANKVSYIKNTGNNVLISDVYVKPKISKNQSNYYFNKNNYEYRKEPIIYRGNVNNKRPFPTSTHNHVFFVSK